MRSRTSAPTTACDARRGNLISGVKRRLSDSTSVYLEERYQDTRHDVGAHACHGRVSSRPTSAGTSAPTRRSARCSDSVTGAETERQAGGIRVGYGVRPRCRSRAASSIGPTMREQLDATYDPARRRGCSGTTSSISSRDDWRVIGKLNHSTSESSLGAVLRRRLHRGRDRLRVSSGAATTGSTRWPSTRTSTTCRRRIRLTLQSLAAEFIQKSHIAALDLTYDLTAAGRSAASTRTAWGR